MVDAVVFGLVDGDLRILLIRRKEKPYKGRWALPGGHVEIQETVEAAVHRELFEETNVRDVFLEQLHVFSEIDRDPREPTVSVAFYSLTRHMVVRAGTDASHAGWFRLHELPPLAFDHEVVVEMAMKRLAKEVWARRIVRSLMPEFFTMSQLHNAYQQLVRKTLDPKNFRRDILKKGFLEQAEDLRPRWQQQKPTKKTPAFYRFTPEPV
jgi:8-oxo-dGTP diphosphatase